MVDLLYAYTYCKQLYNGDWGSGSPADSADVAQCALQLSVVLTEPATAAATIVAGGDAVRQITCLFSLTMVATNSWCTTSWAYGADCEMHVGKLCASAVLGTKRIRLSKVFCGCLGRCRLHIEARTRPYARNP